MNVAKNLTICKHFRESKDIIFVLWLVTKTSETYQFTIIQKGLPVRSLSMENWILNVAPWITHYPFLFQHISRLYWGFSSSSIGFMLYPKKIKSNTASISLEIMNIDLYLVLRFQSQKPSGSMHRVIFILSMFAVEQLCTLMKAWNRVPLGTLSDKELHMLISQINLCTMGNAKGIGWE